MKSKSILRKALSVFTAMAMSFSFMTFSAVGVNASDSGTCGDNVTWTLENGTLTISGTGAMADYTYYLAASPSPWIDSAGAITNVVIENGVTSIGSYAFSQCTTLTSVTIPDSVTSIGICAFQDCWVLGAVTIPSSVTSIGNSAFYSCQDLTSITIPSSVTSIGNQAFYGCYDLTTVTIPSSVTSIGNNAFAGCTDLETVNLPCNWDENPLYTFGGNVSTTTKHNIENGTCTVCGLTFTCGDNLTWSLDNGTLTISGTGDMANYTYFQGKSPSPWFDSAGDITNVVIEDGVTSIGNYAFSDLNKLTSVTIPSGVTSIGDRAFYFCLALGEVNIPSGVTSIGDSAFYGCYDLTTVTIPSSVTSIGNNAFLNCTDLESVNLPCNWNDSIFTFDESVEKIIAEHTSSGPATSTTPEKCTVCGYIISPATGSNNNSSSGGSSSSSSKESPNIEGRNGRKGWSAISDVIEDTKEGEKVVIDMNDATELPKNILKEIKGKDITIVLNMDNGFIWTINGKDVENPKTIDMGVKKGTRIPVKVINEVTGESEYIEITLSHNGDFGFKAVLTVDMGKNNKGNFANLYYYNGKEMDIICSDEIDENGKADLTFTHASEYVIVIDDTDHTDLSAGESIKVEEIVLL